MEIILIGQQHYHVTQQQNLISCVSILTSVGSWKLYRPKYLREHGKTCFPSQDRILRKSLRDLIVKVQDLGKMLLASTLM